MLALIVILVLVVLVLGGTAAVRLGRRRQLPPAQHHPALPQKLPPEQPGFRRHNPADPGFRIEYRTGGHGPPPQARPGKPPARPSGLGNASVSRNPTATCKLTGKQVADCTCAKCNGIS